MPITHVRPTAGWAGHSGDPTLTVRKPKGTDYGVDEHVAEHLVSDVGGVSQRDPSRVVSQRSLTVS